ncbi:Aldo-ket-red domain-containing protein [Mycena chlorophos]|uniref:Aldo-ket-red domain-containing protein n=1 Tax=Mycena chlorophos TaxID=658473 RepID=A0A8H6VUE6_MYCCL|nr:Aldo-ket-red domain-containing protein [Mycena chlorophos]
MLVLAFTAALLTLVPLAVIAQPPPPNLPPGPAIALNSDRYPTVTDHHCLALVCNYINTNGMIRDQSPNLRANEVGRRRAIGCGGITNCRTRTTGMSCDEIAYASTYSGGLGCYAADYLATGGVMADLPPLGTHRCVNAVENSAHGGAVNRFYQLANVGDGVVFYFTFLIPPNGCLNAASTYCRRMFNIANGNGGGDTYANICQDGLADGTQFAGIVTSQRTRGQRCPSRGYGPANITSSEDESTDSFQEEEDYGLAGNITVTPGPEPSLTDQVYQLSSGRFIWSPFHNNGTLALGDPVVIQGNDTDTEVSQETIVAAGRFGDMFGSDSLPDCPT